MIWSIMRDAAIWRHRWIHHFLEGDDPAKWPMHESTVKAFYGW